MDPKLTNTETEARMEGEEQGVNGCANEPKRDARLRRAVPVGKRRPEAGPSNSKQLEETARPGLEDDRTTLTTVATQYDFQGRAVRTEIRDGQVWFVAADVCAVLEHTDPSKVVSRLEDYERGATNVRTLGGEQEMNVISESGLYALILTSRKPQAKAFRRWVTGEVLPSIRRTGAYHMEPSTGRPERAGARHVELPGDGLYVVTASPGRPTHIRQVDYDAMINEVDSLDARIMACALVTIAAYWQRVQQMNAIAFDPKGTYPLARLERAVIEGADLAQRHFKATEAAGSKLEK